MAERSLVRDLMVVGVTTCRPDTPVIDIARLLLAKNLESIVVLDQGGHAVGTVGRDELIRAYSHEDVGQMTAQDIMRDEVPQIPPDIPLAAAAQIMQDLGIRQVFLMHHAEGVDYPAASLAYTQLLRHLAADDQDDLNDLGIKAAREAPLDTFIRRRDKARKQSLLTDEE